MILVRKVEPGHTFGVLGCLHFGLKIWSPPNLQIHTGFVVEHPNENSGAAMIHLAWHRDLKIENLTENVTLLASQLHPENQKVVAEKCAWIARKNVKTIPYGVGSTKAGFSTDGYFAKQRPEDGLTCATYVIEIMAFLGFKVANTDSWPHRDEDHVWQKNILEQLERYLKRNPHPLDRFRLNKQVKLIGKVIRIRPEEAAVAAAAFGELDEPRTFEAVLPDAQALAQLLRAAI